MDAFTARVANFDFISSCCGPSVTSNMMVNRKLLIAQESSRGSQGLDDSGWLKMYT